MKITREQFKTIVKEVMTEENEYQAFFQKALDKAGKSIPSMSDEEKKAFFDKIDAAWNGKGEKNEELVGGQKELDVDGDGDISSDDLADLRAGKKADESVNEDKRANILNIDFTITEKGDNIFFAFKDKKEGIIKIRKIGSNKIVNFIQDVLDKTYGKGSYFFKSGKNAEFIGGYEFGRNPNNNKIDKLKFESVNEDYDGPVLMRTGNKNTFKVGEKVTFNDNGKKREYKVIYSKGNGDFTLKLVESVNEIQYKDAIQKFNDELIKHPMVKKVAQHYKKTPAEIVKVLQQRLSTKGNRGGDTKEVSVDFKDTDSGITIKHKKMFNESVNEEEIKWNAVENAIINFLKMNTKILDKRVKDKDTDGVKGGLQSIIDGLTNAQRSLKLK